MSNVLISVVSQFDKKGFTQADRGISALTKTVAKFTGGLALAHKTQQAMLSYMADEKATKILAQNLKNLGFAYGSAGAEEFIASLQQQTGILDDELRPAYAQLARVTGSNAETQRLMSLAFDVSSGTGQDYASVIDALSQAYVGNTKGLKSLNIGLTQAELKTKSFKEITDLLNQEFKGAGAAALDSYAGKMAILQVTTANAAETIGKSLLDALSTASGEGGFESFIKNIDSAAAGLSRLITIAGRGISAIKIFGNPTKTMQEKLTEFKKLQTQVWAEDLSAAQRKAGMKVWYPEQKAAATALAKLEKDRLALLKKQTAEKKAQAALDKANALVAKAKEQFDLEGIQLVAALQNKTLTANEKERLEIKKATWELEQAIAQEDMTRIAAATALLEKLLKQNSEMAQMKLLIEQIGKIFDTIGLDRSLIDVKNLAEALALLKQFQSVNFALTGEGKPMGGSLSGYTPNEILSYNAANAAVNPDMPVFESGLSGYYGMSPTPSQASQDIYITAIIEGNVMSQNDLAEAIRQQIQDAQQSGKDVNWARQALPATFL